MFESLVSTLESGLLAGAMSGAGTVQGLAASGLAAGISLYMLLACLAVVRGIAGDGFGHVVTQGIKASLVWAALAGSLAGDVGSLALNLPTTLGAGNVNIGSTADNYINQVIKASADIVKESTPPEAEDMLDMPGMIYHYSSYLVLVVLAQIPVSIAYFFGAIIVTMAVFLKFALAITAAFAPLFVALILYDSTRGMFFTWLGAALGYAISIVVIGIVAAAFLLLVPAVISSVPSNVTSVLSGDDVVMQGAIQLLALSGIGLVGIAFLLQAQGIGQALGGGGGGSGAGVVGSLMPSLYTARLAGGMATKFTGLNAAGRALNALGGMSAREAGSAVMKGTKAAGSAAKSRYQTFRGQGSAAKVAAPTKPGGGKNK